MQNLDQLIDMQINDISFSHDILNDITDQEPSLDGFLEQLRNINHNARLLLKRTIRVEQGFEPLKVALVGEFSSGKSSFLNSLIGANIAPTSDRSLTSNVTTFKYGEKIVYYTNQNDRLSRISKEEYEERVVHNPHKKSKISRYIIEGPWPILRNFEILDTPGFNRVGDVSKSQGGDDELTKNTLRNEADVLFWLIDANTGNLSASQLEILKEIYSDVKKAIKIYVIVNKSDFKTTAQLEKIELGLIDVFEKEGIQLHDVFCYSAKSIMETKSHFLDEILSDLKNEIIVGLECLEDKEISASLEHIRGERVPRSQLKFKEKTFVLPTKTQRNNGIRFMKEFQEIEKILNKLNEDKLKMSHTVYISQLNHYEHEMNDFLSNFVKNLDKVYLSYKKNNEKDVDTSKRHLERFYYSGILPNISNLTATAVPNYNERYFPLIKKIIEEDLFLSNYKDLSEMFKATKLKSSFYENYDFTGWIYSQIGNFIRLIQNDCEIAELQLKENLEAIKSKMEHWCKIRVRFTQG